MERSSIPHAKHIANDTALVSIIIPYYNNVDTIRDAINSALNQTHSNIEIIVVDDGSKIPLTEVLGNQIQDLPGLTLLSQKNSGPSAARNLGAKNSNGSFFVFLDADDKLAASYISSCLAIFDQKNDVSIVYSEAAFFGAKEGKWELPAYKFETFIFCNCIPIFAMVKRKEFFAVHMFDEYLRYNEDWDLWLRMISKFGGVYRIPEILYFYRKQHSYTSLTDLNDQENSKISEKNYFYIFHKNFDLYEKAGAQLFHRVLREPQYQQKYLSLRKKYYDVWYRKIFYKIKGRKHWENRTELQ